MRSGDIAFGRFVIESRAGTGGMGTVYRAKDMKGGELVALKVLRFDDEADADRFAREASLLAQVSHPGIVRYIAHGQTDEGSYIAMEWLEGEDLGARLDREGLTIAESILLARRVAEALAVTHRAGIVHRDVKPKNLFLCEGWIERVKILDFGIARFAAPGSQMTITGAMLGTPGYMAPEQAQGSKDLDARADVFSLGCVLFKCLTGKPVFAGETVIAVLAKTILEETPRVSDHRDGVPVEVDDLVAHFLAKDRDQRPADGAAALRALVAIGDVPVSIAAPLSRSHVGLTESERRVVCVVFVGGSAALSLSASGGRDGALKDLGDAYGGRIDFLADGSLMVTVSGAGAATDLAARSARCALALRALMPDVPMALATGTGVLSSLHAKRSASQPLGALVDRGVALLEGASPGIRLDEATAGLLDVRFHVEPDEKGLCLLGEREVVEGQRTLLGKPYSCVGREREIAMLESIWAECVEEPIARVALVTSAAGRGKSRVRFEFLRRLRERGTRSLVLFGRGDSVSAGSPFGLLAPAIRREAGILDGEPNEVKRRRLRARVARSTPPESAGRIAEFLGELAGIPSASDATESLRSARRDAQWMGDAMLSSFLAFLHAECRVQPVLLVLEDLQWGDLPTVRFVDAALASLSAQPFMVLALGRPDVHRTFTDLFREREVQEIRLGALTPKASERLAREVLGSSASDEVIARIVERAGGNAFYLEELIRAVGQGVSGEDLPETVLGMVQARLDALGTEAKRVLRAASIFGQTFYRGGVAALLGGEARATGVREQLAELVAREVIAPRGEAARTAEAGFMFRHALIRDAAYAMLTDGDRALGHRLAAEWLERVGESDPMVLAEHFVRGGLGARAITWFSRAAELALEGNDLPAALERAERAIQGGAEGHPRGVLRLIQCEAHKWRGEIAEAYRHGKEAEGDLEKGTDAWLRVIGELIAISAQLGHTDETESWAYEACEGSGISDVASGSSSVSASVSALVICLSRAVHALLQVGRREKADQLLDVVQALAPNLARLDRSACARVHTAWATRAIQTGHFAAALTQHSAALECYEEIGDARNAALVRINLGFEHNELGEHEKAERDLREALSAAERMKLSNVEGWSLNNLGRTLHLLGKRREGKAILERALDLGKAQGSVRLESASRLYLSDIERAAGDLDEAEAQARAAVALTETVPPMHALSLATLSFVLLDRKDAAAALDVARRAQKMLDSLQGIEGDAVVRVAFIECLLAAGKVDEARQQALDARERLLSRAAKIEDEESRSTMLKRVPENARTLELADSLDR